MFNLKNKNQTLTIFPISDVHVGSPQFNQEYYEFMLQKFDQTSGEKIIYLLGDLMDCARKNLANSSYKQTMSPNEQLDYVIKTLKPYKKHIKGAVSGNHEDRFLKEFDLDLTQILCSSLDIPYMNQIYETLTINDKPYTVWAAHGSKNSAQLHLMMGQFVRQTSHVNANLYLMGHCHKGSTMSELEQVNDGFIRKHYVLTGSFLDYEGSYAQGMLLKPQLPCFSKISIDKNLRTTVDLYNIDEVLI